MLQFQVIEEPASNPCKHKKERNYKFSSPLLKLQTFKTQIPIFFGFFGGQHRR